MGSGWGLQDAGTLLGDWDSFRTGQRTRSLGVPAAAAAALVLGGPSPMVLVPVLVLLASTVVPVVEVEKII
jgi:hypothetical protein